MKWKIVRFLTEEWSWKKRLGVDLTLLALGLLVGRILLGCGSVTVDDDDFDADVTDEDTPDGSEDDGLLPPTDEASEPDAEVGTDVESTDVESTDAEPDAEPDSTDDADADADADAADADADADADATADAEDEADAGYPPWVCRVSPSGTPEWYECWDAGGVAHMIDGIFRCFPGLPCWPGWSPQGTWCAPDDAAELAWCLSR